MSFPTTPTSIARLRREEGGRAGGAGLGARCPAGIVLLLAFLVPAASLHAGTVVSGSVEGSWTLTGSPYWVEGDLTLASGRTLTLEPGVQVRFRGPYRFMVNGNLQSVGTETDSILFTWDQPISSHQWRGIRLVGADSATRLEFCRIERVLSATSYPEVQGGGIYCQACSPTIRHCLFQYNISHNANSNGMGGGVACISASPSIEFCVMRQNNADSGGGICTMEEGCTPIIRNNLITGNQAPYAGGGIYAGVRSSPVIENNTITENRAYGWGGGGITLWNWYAMNHISKTVKNNVISGNWTSAVGGGFYIRYDYSFLENNTVVDNTASGGGGGLYVLNQGYGDFPPDIRNFILWGNTGGSTPSIYTDPSTGSVVYVTYSDVEGGWTGIGNINLPPQFADQERHLAGGSPCIDAGNPDPLYNDTCFPPSLGTARNDMGAYGGPRACQWPQVPSEVEDGFRTGPAASRAAVAVFLEASPNPLGAFTSLCYELPAQTRIELGIFDAGGRLIRALIGGSVQEAGVHRVSWDGRDAGGRRAGSGVYFCRLRARGLGEDRLTLETVSLVVSP